jgi:hypothetical protein
MSSVTEMHDIQTEQLLQRPQEECPYFSTQWIDMSSGTEMHDIQTEQLLQKP